MELDLQAVRAAVQVAKADDRSPNFVIEHINDEVLDDFFGPYVEAHGVDAVLEALVPHKDDTDVAEALGFVAWWWDRNLLAVFTEEEIVDAAIQLLDAFREGRFTDTRGLPHWGWSALCQHDYGDERVLPNESAFRILLAVIERAPIDDNILSMLGDIPLSNALGHPEYHARLVELAKTEPKIPRAVALDAAYWGIEPAL